MLILSAFLSTESIAIQRPIPEDNDTLLCIQYTSKWHEHHEASIRLEWKQSLQGHFNDLPLNNEVLWEGDYLGGNKMSCAIFDNYKNPSYFQNPHFYKVTKGEKIFLLLGTLHIAQLWMLEWPLNNLQTELLNCDTLICERYDEENPDFVNERQQYIVKKYTNPSNDWFGLLPDAEQRRLHKICEISNQLSLIDLNFDIRILPTFIESIFMSISMDFDIQDHFKKNNKKIIGLDTTEEHLDMFDKYLKTEKEACFNELKKIIQDSIHCGGNLNDSKIIETIKHYLSGNIHLLSPLGIDGTDLELTKQNENWWERLATLLNDHSNPCVVVGLAHCIGKNSFLDFAFKEDWHVQKWNKANACFDADLTHPDILINFNRNFV